MTAAPLPVATGDRAGVPADPVPGARGAHHVGLSVADLPAMIDFYARALGFVVEVEFTLPGGAMSGAMLRRPDGAGLELLYHRDASGRPPADPNQAMLAHGYGHWALSVTDVPATHARLLAAGAEEVWAPRPAPPPATGAMSFLRDPEGNLFELVEVSPAATDDNSRRRG